MEPTSASQENADDKEAPAHALERAKRDLEDQIAHAVATYEHDRGDEPLEVSLNFEREGLPEGDENEANAALTADIARLVDDFHDAPSVSGKGVRVLRLTAIDSDADGEVAVQVDYDYAGYE